MAGFITEAQSDTASLLLEREGALTSFQLYTLDQDLVAGSEDPVASGDPVEAAMTQTTETRRQASPGREGSRPVRARMTVYHVEFPAFEPDGLTKEWKPTVDGVERDIEDVVMGPDNAYYVIRLTTGGQ